MTANEFIKEAYELHFGTQKYKDSNLKNTFEKPVSKAIEQYAKHEKIKLLESCQLYFSKAWDIDKLNEELKNLKDE